MLLRLIRRQFDFLGRNLYHSVKGESAMDASTVSAKGTITVPARIRRKFGTKKGTKVAFIVQDGKLIMQPQNKDYFMKMAGILGTKGKLLKALMEERKQEREREGTRAR
jgi:AbrB family looped-hinge helix DNA binding protein